MRANSAIRPSTPVGAADPAIRIYTAYNLDRHLATIDRRRRRLVRETVVAAAMIELVRHKLGAAIDYHAFSAAGLDLVICASWQDARSCLRVEIDLRTGNMPLATIETKPAKVRKGGNGIRQGSHKYRR